MKLHGITEIDEMTEKIYFYNGKNYSKSEIQRLLDRSEEESTKYPDPRIINTLKMLEGKDVLDVGCAAGSITKNIAQKGFKVHGIDVLETSIEIAKEFNSVPNASYEVRDLLKEPFPENSFDCITFLETIEHVESPSLYLRAFHRILRPGGYVILSTPNATSFKNLLYALSYRRREKQNKVAEEIALEPRNIGTQLEHIYNWDFPTLIRLLDRCGFDHVDHAFARTGPIVVPFLGKRIQVIKMDSKILRSFGSLMVDQIIKVRKRT